MIKVACVAFVVLCALATSARHAEGAGGPKKVWTDAEITSAAKKSKIGFERDRFTQSTVFGPVGYLEETGGNDVLGLSGSVHLYMCCRVSDDSLGQQYYLRLRYKGRGWLFLTGTLRLLIDDEEPISIEGPDSSGEREVGMCTGTLGCEVSEATRIPIPNELASRLARATSLEFRAVGSKASIERWWKKANLAEARALFDYMHQDLTR